MKIAELNITAPPQGLAGTRGPSVKLLQQALESLGYSVGNTGVDGIYGPRTARAVKQFQQDAGITVDGDAGPETVKALGSAVTQRRASPKAQQDAPEQPSELSNTQQAEAVLDLIAQPESAGRYDAVYPGKRNPKITDMTLSELFQDMRSRARRTGSSASGRYQYISKTLKEITQEMGLNPDTTKFTPQVQDAIALYHLKTRHGLDRWMQGKISSERFLRKLSKTWAGLPDPKTGASFYKGVLNNRAGITASSALDMLDQIRGIA